MMRIRKKSALDQLLNRITPLEQRQADTKMTLAKRIAKAMDAKGMSNNDLLAALNRNSPSLVTRWLSGTQNFTVDMLVELEVALDIELIQLKECS